MPKKLTGLRGKQIQKQIEFLEALYCESKLRFTKDAFHTR